MLGLPSTTEVGRRIPKEVFYRNLKLSPKQKDAACKGIYRVCVADEDVQIEPVELRRMLAEQMRRSGPWDGRASVKTVSEEARRITEQHSKMLACLGGRRIDQARGRRQERPLGSAERTDHASIA